MTESDNDERSVGSAVSSDSLVMVSEHNLKEITKIYRFKIGLSALAMMIFGDKLKERHVCFKFSFPELHTRTVLYGPVLFIKIYDADVFLQHLKVGKRKSTQGVLN